MTKLRTTVELARETPVFPARQPIRGPQLQDATRSRAGLSPAISARSRRRSAFIAVREIGSRSASGEIGTTRLTRADSGHIRATHPGAQMTARGVAGDDDRTRDQSRRDFDGARDLLGHRADPGFGRERVGGHGAGPSARHRARSKMRPHLAIEPQPIAAMDEHQETLWRGFRQKEVETVARFRTIRDGSPGSLPQGGAKSRRLSRPTRRKGFGAGNERAVGVGAVVIHSGVPACERQLRSFEIVRHSLQSIAQSSDLLRREAGQAPDRSPRGSAAECARTGVGLWP